MGLVEFIGTFAGICTSIALIPQLVRIIRQKKAEEISIYMLMLLLIGLGLWIIYGLFKNDIPIIVTNSFSFLINAALLILRIRYNK